MTVNYNAKHYFSVICDDVEQDLKLEQLGASPAELDYNVESERQMSFASFDSEAELRLWEGE